MSDTPNLGLTYLEAAQAQKHVTVNEALRRLDALLHVALVDRDLAAPPAAPADGARYLVAPGATGAWVGRDGQVAAWQDGAWAFLEPRPGWIAFLADEGKLILRTASGWIDLPAYVQSLAMLGILTTPDATNRLAVKSNAVLFSHDDVTPGTGDIRVTLNKSASGRDAGLVLQAGYSTRALLGLLASDDLAIKVSPDGSSFLTALAIDRASGLLTHADGVIPRTLSVQSAGSANTSSSGSGAYQAHTPAVTIPPAFLRQGRALRITTHWRLTTGSAPPALDLAMRLGGSVVSEALGITPVPSRTNDQFALQWLVQALAAPSAASAVEVAVLGAPSVPAAASALSVTDMPAMLATSGALLLDLATRWSAAGTGTTSIALRQLVVEALN
jgi:hypothetical protein